MNLHHYNKVRRYLVFIALFLPLLVGCSIIAPGRTESSFESYNLSVADLYKIRLKALEGKDSEAAYRMGMYYQVVVGDRSVARNWFRRAAESGNPQAQLLLNKESVK